MGDLFRCECGFQLDTEDVEYDEATGVNLAECLSCGQSYEWIGELPEEAQKPPSQEGE